MATDEENEAPRPTLKHYIEFFPIWLSSKLFKHVPVDISTKIYGALGRWIGPLTPMNERARTNLRFIWPDMPEAEVKRICRGVWDNFARVANDYWTLHQIRRDRDRRVEIVGAENLDKVRESGKPAILFSAHMGNWEMITIAARMRGLERLWFLYRTFNNPLMDELPRDWQRASGTDLVTKGRPGARTISRALSQGGAVIMLIDVRMNDGVAAPFLGVDAMTPSAPAALALKYDAWLVPVRTERLQGAYFRVTVEEPRKAITTGDKTADIQATTAWMNSWVSAWIEDRPEQWMWLHWRWGKRPKRPA